MVRQNAFLFLLCGCLLVSAGCFNPAHQDANRQRESYVEDCMAELGPLGPAGKNLGEALQPWMQGGEADLDRVNATYDRMVKVVGEASHKLDQLRSEPPAGVDRFDAAMADYLDHLDELAAFASATVESVRADNPGDFPVVSAAVQELTRLGEQEQAVLRALYSEAGVR